MSGIPSGLREVSYLDLTNLAPATLLVALDRLAENITLPMSKLCRSFSAR